MGRSKGWKEELGEVKYALRIPEKFYKILLELKEKGKIESINTGINKAIGYWLRDQMGYGKKGEKNGRS